MLKIEDLYVSYGMIEAIQGVNFEINDGEIVALIGANGAGKTTILHTISGLLKPKSGTITLDGTDISKISADKIVRLGLAQVPERRRVFASQTVEENLEMGAFTRKDKDGIAKDMEMVYTRFPRLRERKNQLAGTLSGGEQQMLAMGRALMAKPKILLLDEPSMGLSPLLVKEIFHIIEDIHKQGTTILLIEQNAKMALGIADRAYVLETGKIVLSGTGKELAASEEIKKAYLGVKFMYVKDLMAKDPYCITANTTISKALEIMEQNDFHRLPVVDEKHHLIGLITAGIIADNTPGKATSLSMYELNYLLNKNSVEEIMEKNVHTINPDALLEEAAEKMRKNGVGCLPVIEDNIVVGIITQNDIFTAFIDLLGYHQKGTRYVINVLEDNVGVLSDIADCFSSLNINITNLGVYHNDRGIEVVVIATGDNNDKAADGLRNSGYNVTNVLVRD